MNTSAIYSTLPNKAPSNFELEIFDDGANYKLTIEWFEFKYKSEDKKKKLRFAVIHHLLTDLECKHYIDESERAGYTSLNPYQMSHRSNVRVTVISQKLSNLLFKRLFLYFPESINHDGSTWEPFGLNEVFRFCRYGPGGVFDAHRDAYFARSSNERSFMTINIYLNDTDAGYTRFLNPKSKKVIFKCQPQAGKALVFQHNEYHDGDILRSGSKYLMRTDFMYRLKPQIDRETNYLNDKQNQEKLFYVQTEESEEKDSVTKPFKVKRKPWPCSQQ